MLVAQNNFFVGAERAVVLAICLAETCFMVWFLVGLARDSKRVKSNSDSRVERTLFLPVHRYLNFTSIATTEIVPVGDELESRSTEVKARKQLQKGVTQIGDPHPRKQQHYSEGLLKASRILMLVLATSGLVLAQSAVEGNIGKSPNDEIRQLRALVEQLQTRVARLEQQGGKKQNLEVETDLISKNPTPTPPPSNGSQILTQDDSSTLDFLHDTTLNFTFDGYYGYNFNRPVGRVNLLRAYDVTSNSFSINQATVILERAPDPSNGRRFGGRIDLQYGQATEMLQGSAVNELRPQAYRPIFQAYGTYVAPVASGLTIDFGKWASALGPEGNYSKDQINYSRSYFFNFLPFYHMGFRASYNVNPHLTVAYWLVNGANQAEDFNSFKSQNFEFVVKPTSSFTWTSNYYFGQESHDIVPILNPGLPTLATQPGLPLLNVSPEPNGREHIFDNYASWAVEKNLTLSGEFDYVINRQFHESTPAHVIGGAAYARYQVSPKIALGARAEYLSDRGGLFSGVTQALKETTATYEYKIADGLITRLEWRRDFSNQPFFLTETSNVLKKEQNTATLGLIWWWGRKSGSW
jgi:Putative beta-barrel porin-2, OmpL-like. bbp2